MQLAAQNLLLDVITNIGCFENSSVWLSYLYNTTGILFVTNPTILNPLLSALVLQPVLSNPETALWIILLSNSTTHFQIFERCTFALVLKSLVFQTPPLKCDWFLRICGRYFLRKQSFLQYYLRVFFGLVCKRWISFHLIAVRSSRIYTPFIWLQSPSMKQISRYL